MNSYPNSPLPEVVNDVSAAIGDQHDGDLAEPGQASDGPNPLPGSPAQRLQRLHELVAKRAPTEWRSIYVEAELALDPGSPDARCPRYAGIVEESGDQAVILAETEADLGAAMAEMFTSEIPIRPIELVDLDTLQHRAAVCEATARFLQPAEEIQAVSRQTVA